MTTTSTTDEKKQLYVPQPEHSVYFLFMMNWCGQFIVLQVQGHAIKLYAISSHETIKFD